MKKLFFSLLALMSTFSANAQVEPVSGTAYYLYNTESGKFLTRGKSWGTQAIVESVGLPWQVTIAEGKYKLQMFDLVKAGSNTGLGSNGFSDNGTPVALEPSGNANGYTLALGVNQDNTINMSGTGTWQFLTTEQYRALQASKTAAQNAAIATAAGLNGDIATIVANTSEWTSKDVTSKIPAVNNANWAPTKNGDRGGNQNQGNYGVESYTTGDATYSCTISGLQPGVYKVGIKALHRSASNAADLAVGNAGYDCSSAFLDANGYRVAVKDWYSSRTGDATPNSTGQFVDIANAGGYYSEVFTYVGDDGVLRLTAAATSYWGSCWFLFNSCTLTYYTNSVSDEDATAILASVPTLKMDATVRGTLDYAKTTFEGAKTIANYNALQSAIESANSSVAAYAAAKKIADGANAKAAAADVTLNASAFNAAYEAGSLNGNTEAEALVTAVNAAINEKIAGCTDKTAKITNPSFEDGKLTGWTNVGFGNPATNKNFGALTGNIFVEKWVAGPGKLTDGSLKQTIANLPVGEYILTVDAKNEQQSGNTAETGFFAVIGDKKYEVFSTSVDHCAVSFSIDAKSDITIGVELDGCTGNWVCFDNFKLYFNGIDPEGLAEEIETATTLYNSYDAAKQYAIDLKTAIDAAQASYDEGFTSVETLNTAVSTLLAAVNVAKHAARVETYAQIEDGRYVLSIGGRFLGAGNAWGTQASLLAHPEYVELAKLNDGKYTIKSQVSNGNGKDYFNGEYMDGVATGIEIIATDGGYYLSDGVKYYFNNNGVVGSQDEPVKWTIKSLTEMDAEIANATDETPYDITYKLVDPNFGRNNIHAGEWERTAVDRKGANDNNLYEAYKKTFSISQTVTSLPAGYYVVKATALYRQDGEDEKLPYIFANGEKVDFDVLADNLGDDPNNHAATAAALMAQGNYEVSVRVLVSNGTLELGAATEGATCWALFDNFQLYAAKRGLPATSADYAALNTAISAAEDNTIGFMEGEYAPYTNVDAIKALADAKAVNQEVENPLDAVQALTTALTSAIWTANTEEMNAVYDGTFASATNDGAPAGWTMSNNTLGGAQHSRAFVGDSRLSEFGNDSNSAFFIRFDGTNSNRGSMYYYGRTEGYTMPLKENTTYYVSVDFAGWGSTGKPLRLNVTGPAGFSAVGVQANTTFKADTETTKSPQNHTIVFTTGPAGDYQINFQTPGADSNTHMAVVSNIVLKTAESVTASVSDAKWATFIAPFAFDLTDTEIEAYTVTGATDGVLALEAVAESGKKIPANTPVLLNCANQAEKINYGKNIATQNAYTVGWLTGTYTDTEVGEGHYMLAKKDGVVGFYQTEARRKNKAGKAYLDVPAGVKAAAFFLGENDADAIKALEALTSGNAEIFDLNGRKLNTLQKGINIVNGKKVLVK